MLAMNATTPRGVGLPALSLTTIASMLAPTGDLLRAGIIGQRDARGVALPGSRSIRESCGSGLARDGGVSFNMDAG